MFPGVHLLTLLIASASLIVMFTHSIKRPPTWLSNGPLEKHWKKINITGLITSVFLGLIAFIIYRNFIPEYQALAVSSTMILSFILVQSFFTDVAQRLVDRKVLYWAMFFMGIIATWFVFTFGDETLKITFVLFVIISSAFIFLPVFGASDGRALTLMVMASIPVLGTQQFINASYIFIALLILIGIIMAIKTRKMKVMIPAVPIIIAPYLSYILLYPLITG